MTKLSALCVAALACGGCTSGMHRAYQWTMASAASGMFVFDGAQTVTAVRSGTPEGNPAITMAFGEHPAPWQTWTIAGGQALITPFIITIPGTRDRDDTGEYLKDAALTCLVMIEGFAVWANAQNRNLPILSSWH